MTPLTGEESLCRSHPDMEEKSTYRKGYLHRHFHFGLVEFLPALWIEHPYVGQECGVSALEPPTLCQSPQMLENCEAVRCKTEIHKSPAYLSWAKTSVSESFSSPDAFMFSLTYKTFVRTRLGRKRNWSILNILMISFPCPIWAANTSSPR